MNSDRYGKAPRKAKVRSLTRKEQQRNSIAAFLAYVRFCRLHPLSYRNCIANQIRLFLRIDERREEVQADGKQNWVPTADDFEYAWRDCWDDLVKQ